MSDQTTMATIRAVLNIVSPAAALAAAALWFMSARVSVPGMTYGDPEVNPMHIALRKVATLNAWAAGFAAVSALCQAAGFFL
jgi:hypothetical protein